MHTIRCSDRLRKGCLRGGVSASGCVCPGGVFALPAWTEFLTHAFENITFPQLLLRTVKMYLKSLILETFDGCAG